VLVVHGTEEPDPPVRRDRGAAAGADRRPARSFAVEGGPHNLGWTHSDEVNSALLEFIATKVT